MANKEDEKKPDLIEILKQYLATRSQPEREASPSYHQKTIEKEGRSPWSGGWAGGRER